MPHEPGRYLWAYAKLWDWNEFTGLSNAVAAIIAGDYLDAFDEDGCTPLEYRRRIGAGNLMSYARCLVVEGSEAPLALAMERIYGHGEATPCTPDLYIRDAADAAMERDDFLRCCDTHIYDESHPCWYPHRWLEAAPFLEDEWNASMTWILGA